MIACRRIVRNRSALIVAGMLSAAAWMATPCLGQTTTTTQQTQQNINLNQLLQSLGGLGLGGLGGVGGLGTGTGTTTGGTTTGGTTTGGTTTGGTTTGTQRVPGIIGNQFTTTSGGALGQRRPGLFIKQSFALQDGTLTLPGTPAPIEPNFFRDTATQISQAVIDVVKGLLQSLNTAVAALGGTAGVGTGSGTTTIPNAATTGAGTTTTIP